MPDTAPSLVCFLALRVPAEHALREHQQVRSGLGDAAASFRLTRPEGWHVTLFYLGLRSQEEIGRLEPRLRAALGELRAPELELCGAGAFPRRGRERVLWLGVQEPEGAEGGRGALGELHEGLLEQLEAEGIETSEERGRPWVPHVTVARPRSPGSAVPETFYGRRPRGRWRPSGVELYESIRGQGPARYESRALFPLRG